jgi:hypothetical protein
MFTPFVPVRINIGTTPDVMVNYGLEGVRKQFEHLEGEFHRWGRWTRDASPSVVEYALQPAFDKSQEYVPHKTGRLKNSGYLKAERVGNDTQAEIGYGKNGDPDYAILVHELPKFHPAPTRWKYLQQALQDKGPAVQDRLETTFAYVMALGGT